MRLYDDFMCSNKEMSEITRSYNKLIRKKINYKKVVKEGGLRWVENYPTHSTVTCQGYIRKEYRHRITETDLAMMILGAYPDCGGYCQIFPDNFFIAQLDFIPRSLELKKAGKFKRMSAVS